jgi:hypothetical protein
VGSLALLLIIVGAFLVYEVAKNVSNAEAANSTNTSSSGSSNVSNLSATTGGRLFPQKFYDVIAGSESGGYNPPTLLNGQPSYSFFGIGGIGPAGQSNGISSNGQPVSLAAYQSAEQAFQAFDSLVSSGRYAPAYAQYSSSGNICQFVIDIANAGYVQADQRSQWISNMLSGLGC